MTPTRKTWWPALALSLPLAYLAGCGETPETPAGAPAVSPAPSTPVAPAPTKPSELPDAPKTDAPKTDAPKTDAPKTDAPKTAASVKLTGDELAEIKKLPAGEVDAAVKQAVCPVSDHHLGGMGAPIKVTAEGKSFYICCDDCKEKATKDAKTYLAKLAK